MPREAQCKSEEDECVLMKASLFKNRDDLIIEHTRLIPPALKTKSWSKLVEVGEPSLIITRGGY